MPPFADASGATVHVNDVGPLLGQLEMLRDQQPIDEATQALWSEAVSRALTGQLSSDPG